MNSMYLLGQEAIETGAAASTIVERVDPDALGAMMVLSVIGGVFALVAIVWMVSRMITNIFAHRENTRLVTDLLNRGYSPDEIQKLVAGCDVGLGKANENLKTAAHRKPHSVGAAK